MTTHSPTDAPTDSPTSAAVIVGIVMGSDSDLPVMQAAADVLTELGMSHEIRVVSAHRTPADMLEYATAAAGRGLQVLIAGAGGAAHLPGMLAAATRLPVIGVPVPLRHLEGLDSLLSIVQMPSGVPVATVAIGAAGNAGLLAARILGLADPVVAAAVSAHQDGLAARARAADARVRQAPTGPPPPPRGHLPSQPIEARETTMLTDQPATSTRAALIQACTILVNHGIDVGAGLWEDPSAPGRSGMFWTAADDACFAGDGSLRAPLRLHVRGEGVTRAVLAALEMVGLHPQPTDRPDELLLEPRVPSVLGR